MAVCPAMTLGGFGAIRRSRMAATACSRGSNSEDNAARLASRSSNERVVAAEAGLARGGEEDVLVHCGQHLSGYDLRQIGYQVSQIGYDPLVDLIVGPLSRPRPSKMVIETIWTSSPAKALY